MKKLTIIVFCFLLLQNLQSFSQIVPVGSGSYTTTFPGVDAANRNAFPSGSPQLTGNAANKPVPTNDWWSALIKTDHANNLFNYPLAMRTVNEGLVVSYIVPSSGAGGSSQPMDDVLPITVGVVGLNASKATVSDYSDWTVTMAWNDASHSFYATSGIAMPFLYFTKKSTDMAQVNVTQGSVVIDNEMLIITDARNGSDFAVYAPSGSTWTKNGTLYTSSLNGKNYWSMAFIPPSASSVAAVANEYKKYAYVFPVNTTASWNYNESTAVLTTTFTVSTEVKEGANTEMLMGLLPHQWGHLASSSAMPKGYSYPSIRGEIKTLAGNSFSTENTFFGILPTLPYVDNYSEGFNPAALNQKVTQLENDGLASWTDSYNQGQEMNRLIQTARIADQTGNTATRNKLLATIKSRLENWLKAEQGEVAFLFYYNKTWSAMIGYPAGHQQDANLNDHHFHWGYFIHAAAFVEQFEPGWASKWGDMINLLVRDAASPDRNDALFPFLRNFSPYAGHCWANGFATFPFGNDQESSSESMQFNSSLIHWGTVTGNKAIRDLGIYLYTTEQTATEEYWFDINQRTLKPEYNYSMVSRIWGNGYDNQTFWTSDIAAVYGIEMYPIHGGSLYLGQHASYVEKLWKEISANTGILKNEVNPNLWHDVMWEYLAFIDPKAAIKLYDSNPNRALKFGITDAQTYYWLHAMDALGKVNTAITANYPIAASFTKDGVTTYVAHNYTSTPLVVTFSDGYKLTVPANSMGTSKDVAITGEISSDFTQAYANGSVNLKVTTQGEAISNVEFYDGATLIGTQTDAPYIQKATQLALGMHQFYAKLYVGSLVKVSNIITVQVGNKVAYTGTAALIPGTIEAGNYDSFEGGVGQGICYSDVSTFNEGDYRTNEFVDAGYDATEGATVGWIDAGEWLTYSVHVNTSGVYKLTLRYANGNTSLGGPFNILVDDVALTSNITLGSTSKWDSWASKTIDNLELTAGDHVIKLAFTNGGFNIGKLTFEYNAPLSYNPPVANAGNNVKVLLPQTTGSLSAALSTNPDNKKLTYLWEQVYGPSVIAFSDHTASLTTISNLEEGIYQCRLTVSDGTHQSQCTVLVIVTTQANIAPYVSLTSPANNASFIEGSTLTLAANASDLDGSIVRVDFFDGTTAIGQATSFPFTTNFANAAVGYHTITAVATDNGGASFTSQPLMVTITPAPSCSGGPANGDYTYQFSDAKSNPTLTFIPGATGAGSPTCILYYGTSATGPYPGYNVTPNVPYALTAKQGETIYFYYTYSFAGGDRNTSAAKHTYTIGTCSGGTPISYLSVSTASLSVAAAASNSASFSVSTNVACTLTSNQSWVTLSKNSINQTTTINLAVAANTTTASRTATISIAGEGVSTQTLTVTQAAALPSALVEVENKMLLYPNPANECIRVSGITQASQAYVYDVCGKLVQQALLTNSASSINVSRLKQGIYVLKIQTKNKLVVMQFVKE